MRKSTTIPKKANKSASSEPAPLCLIHGDDDFAVKQRARQVFQSWCGQGESPDQEVIDAQVSNSSEALQAIAKLNEALQTLPFFGGTKVIWWNHCNFLGDDRTASAANVKDSLSDLAQDLKSFVWDNVRLLISASKVDKRKSFYKTLSKAGTVESFSAWSLDDRNWQSEAEQLVLKELRRRKLAINDAALAEFTTKVGPNRQQLISELEKLSLYLDEPREITPADVRSVTTRNKQARAFALGDALGERNLPQLLQTLDEELWELKFDRKKSEIGLLYGLISKVRTMILMKELQRERLIRSSQNYGAFKAQLERIPPEKLPEDRRYNPLAMNPFPLWRAMSHAENYSLAELIQAMQRLLQCNQDLIFSNLDDALILQQTLIAIVDS